METLGTDKLREQELNTGTLHACHLLNNAVIPICRELNFTIDVSDTETLDRYLCDISALHNDYIDQMTEGAGNPALAIVLKKSAEELWEQAYKAHPIANPYIIGSIPDDVMEFVTITGSDIYSFHARANNPAITKACIIEATPEDIAKRDEIKAVCDALNKCFNGLGGLFSGFICLGNDGRFYPIHGATNFKRLIYGK